MRLVGVLWRKLPGAPRGSITSADNKYLTPKENHLFEAQRKSKRKIEGRFRVFNGFVGCTAGGKNKWAAHVLLFLEKS